MPTRTNDNNDTLLNQMCREHYIATLNSVKNYNGREVFIDKYVGDTKIGPSIMVSNIGNNKIEVYTNSIHIVINADDFIASASYSEDDSTTLYVEDSKNYGFYIPVSTTDDVYITNVGRDC